MLKNLFPGLNCLCQISSQNEFYPDVDLETHLSRCINLSIYVMGTMHMLKIKHGFKSSAMIRLEMFHAEKIFFFQN